MPIAIQNRVLLGITFFVGMMLLVGWIAINEPGRMQVFTDQYQGRSIEAGAALFQNNCSKCHGLDGKGNAGQAPGLKNPMLFGDTNPAQDKQNQFKDLQKQVDTLNGQITGIGDSQKKVTDLEAQIAAETDAAKKTQLQTDLDNTRNALKRAQDNLAPNQQKVQDLTGQLTKAQTDLDALIALGWDPNRQVRLKEIAWGGTLQAYIANAVAAGRPLSGLYWPQIMPTWGAAYGGPLRPDEVADVTAYVLNWRDEALKTAPATTKDPNGVKQQFKNPGDATNMTASATTSSVDPKEVIFSKFGKDPNNNTTALGDLSSGDAVKGQQLYTSYACAGCHANGSQGPITKGTWYRVLTQRLADPNVKNVEGANEQDRGRHYLAQSILYPNAYIVPTYNAGVMLATFGSQMDTAQLKDIIAYLQTQNVP